MIKTKLIIILILFMIITACEDDITNVSSGFEIIYNNEEIFIIDHKDKRWEISHAVKNYGFDPAKFRHGLGKDAILPINNPQFLTPGDENFPGKDSRRVIGFKYNADIRAYPLLILLNHEVVNDFYNGKPVIVAYCPLIDLTAVYNRQVSNANLTFAPSGWTYNETFVLYDHQTESLWYHMDENGGLTCISGLYADTILPQLISDLTRWGFWIEDNPQSKILIK